MSGATSMIFGGEGLGLTGAKNKSSQTTTLDPTTKALNDWKLKALTGGNMADSMFSPNAGGAYQIDSSSNAMLNNIQNTANNPGVDMWGWYGNTRNDLSTNSMMDQINQAGGQGRENLYGSLQGQLGYNQDAASGALQNRLGYGEQLYGGNLQNQLAYGQGNLNNTLNSQLAYGQNNIGNTLNSTLGYGSASLGNTRDYNLGYINNQLAPQMMAAGNQYYQNILGPQVGNDYAMMGLARSGGRQEAEGKAAASVALPLQQQLAGMSGDVLGQYGQNLANLNQGAYQQYGQNMFNLGQGAYGQYGQNLFDLGQQAYGQYGQNMGNYANAAYGDYGNQLMSGIQNAYGAYNTGLQNNMQQQYGAQIGTLGNQYQNLFNLNTGFPGAFEQQQQGLMNRQLQGFDASLTGKQWQQQGYENAMNRYLAAINGTPYTPATTVKQSGTNNTGLLNTQFAGSVGSGMGAAM